jgi:hypothetical protein
MPDNVARAVFLCRVLAIYLLANFCNWPAAQFALPRGGTALRFAIRAGSRPALPAGLFDPSRSIALNNPQFHAGHRIPGPAAAKTLALTLKPNYIRKLSETIELSEVVACHRAPKLLMLACSGDPGRIS